MQLKLSARVQFKGIYQGAVQGHLPGAAQGKCWDAFKGICQGIVCRKSHLTMEGNSEHQNTTPEEGGGGGRGRGVKKNCRVFGTFEFHMKFSAFGLHIDGGDFETLEFLLKFFANFRRNIWFPLWAYLKPPRNSGQFHYTKEGLGFWEILQRFTAVPHGRIPRGLQGNETFTMHRSTFFLFWHTWSQVSSQATAWFK